MLGKISEPQSMFSGRLIVDGKMSDSECPDVYVPGVTDVGNMRLPKVKVSGRKTKEVKDKTPVKQPRVEYLIPTRDVDYSSSGTSTEARKGRQSTRGPSLKDLCAEDKLRVANLIKELAKIGEEKEKAVELLHEERLDFEKQILKLLEQQESVLKERETIQTQLFTCQHLLTTYQHQILDKQEHLNKSPVKSNEETERSEGSIHDNHTSSYSTDEDRDCPQQNKRKTTWKKYGVKDRRNGQRSQRIQPSRQDGYDIRMSKYDNVVYGVEVDGGKTPGEHRSDGLRSSEKNSQTSSPRHNERTISNGGQGAVSKGERIAVEDTNIPMLRADPNSNPTYHRPSQVQKVSGMDGENEKGGSLLERLTEEMDGLRTPPKSKCFTDRFQNCRGYRPFPEPVMSSTQKSSEIIADMSLGLRLDRESFHPLPVDSSPRTTKDSAGLPFEIYRDGEHSNFPSGGQSIRKAADPVRQNRVDFAEHDSFDDNGPFHSPNLHGKKLNREFGDTRFVEYYRRLSPRERKKELLGQREALLEEQNRLRQVLVEQEAMLKLKREQLHQQQMIQAKRLAHFEITGVFPTEDRNSEQENVTEEIPGTDARVRFHSPLPKPTCYTTGVNSANQLPGQNAGSAVQGSSPSRVQRWISSTSRVHTSPAGRTSVGTSPIREQITSPIKENMDSPVEIAFGASPRQYADAATSYSRLSSSYKERNAVYSIQGKQGNLPILVNRHQPTSPKPLQSILNRSHDQKGLSIVDIVDKLESSPNSSQLSHHSCRPDTSVTMNSTKGGNSSKDPSLISLDEAIRSEDNDLAELESKVLEDVFFLK